MAFLSRGGNRYVGGGWAKAGTGGRGDSHSSAQKPAPAVGVSPMRPDNLLVSPPVLVATHMVPSRSRATQPTVPWGRYSMPSSLRRHHHRQCRCRCTHLRESVSMVERTSSCSDSLIGCDALNRLHALDSLQDQTSSSRSVWHGPNTCIISNQGDQTSYDRYCIRSCAFGEVDSVQSSLQIAHTMEKNLRQRSCPLAYLALSCAAPTASLSRNNLAPPSLVPIPWPVSQRHHH